MDEGHQVGGSLARPRGGAGNDLPSFHHQRDGLHLDGGRGGVTSRNVLQERLVEGIAGFGRQLLPRFDGVTE